MLAKSCAVSATHSCGSWAPIGCIRLEAGDQAVDPRQMLVHRGDARVGLVRRALRRRPRIHHLPAHRHAVRRILRQQLVQDGRPGPRQADDDERAIDPAGRDLRMRRVHGGHAQAILEQTDDIGTGDHAAEGGEPGVGLEGVAAGGAAARGTSARRSRRGRSSAAPGPAASPRRAGRPADPLCGARRPDRSRDARAAASRRARAACRAARGRKSTSGAQRVPRRRRRK